MAVTIDVFVRDKDGNPVTGLTSDQFRLLQDGEEVATSYFAAFTQESFSRDLLEPDTTAPGESEDRRGIASADEAKPIFIVIFVDNQHLYFSDRNEVLRSLRTFVNEGLGDQAQIMVVSIMQSIEIMQPFTTDSRAVADALRRLRMSEAALDERNEDLQAIRSEIRRSSKYSYQQKAGDKAGDV